MSMIPQLTDSGRAILVKALAGETLNFTKIAIGSGAEPESTDTLTELVDTQIEMEIEDYKKDTGFVTLTGSFDNSEIETGFNWTETGIYAEDEDGNSVLYAYCNTGEDCDDYIPAGVSGKILSTTLHIVVAVDNAENITVTLGESGIYATKTALAELQEEVDSMSTEMDKNLGKLTISTYTDDDGNEYADVDGMHIRTDNSIYVEGGIKVVNVDPCQKGENITESDIKDATSLIAQIASDGSADFTKITSNGTIQSNTEVKSQYGNFRTIESEKINMSDECIHQDRSIKFINQYGAVYADNSGDTEGTEGSARQLIVGVYSDTPSVDTVEVPEETPDAGIITRIDSNDKAYVDLYGDYIYCRNNDADFSAGTVRADTVRGDVIRAGTTLKIGSDSVADLLADKLSLSGGTMTGDIDMGSQSLNNVANITNTYGSDLKINCSEAQLVVEADDGVDFYGADITNVNTLQLAKDPSNDMQAATKQYVDNIAGDYLPLSGGTMSGDITFDDSSNGNITGNNGNSTLSKFNTVQADYGDFGFVTLVNNPTTNMHAATKQYVDNLITVAADDNYLYLGGLLIQWGTVTADSEQETYTVTFPIAYASDEDITNVQLSMTGGGNTGITSDNTTAESFDITDFPTSYAATYLLINAEFYYWNLRKNGNVGMKSGNEVLHWLVVGKAPATV